MQNKVMKILRIVGFVLLIVGFSLFTLGGFTSVSGLYASGRLGFPPLVIIGFFTFFAGMVLTAVSSAYLVKTKAKSILTDDSDVLMKETDEITNHDTEQVENGRLDDLLNMLSNLDKKEESSKKTVTCVYCGTTCDQDVTTCPSCGAKKFK